MTDRAPLNDTLITILGRMVDDAQVERRDPSHYDLECEITRSGLSAGDPKNQGRTVGKAKRTKETLSWAIEHDLAGGEVFVRRLISLIQGHGGFRPTSQNYIGSEVIRDAVEAFRRVNYTLSLDGELQPSLLDSLTGREMTDALRRYTERAQRAADVDAALVTGTGKDLLEAAAAHVLMERTGAYPTTSNFPTLLGQDFINLGLHTPQNTEVSGEPYNCRLERALYEAACSVNTLRNKQGTGHGRPWLPDVTHEEAKRAVQVMGLVAEMLLDKLDGK